MRQPRKLNVALLRNLSKEPLARSAINQIIDGIQNLEYEVISIDDKEHDAEIKLVKQILKNPNSRDDYYDFVAKIMDDILVLNMGCFEKKKTRGKQLFFYFLLMLKQSSWLMSGMVIRTNHDLHKAIWEKILTIRHRKSPCYSVML